jgi:hypothetical protein
MSSSRAIESLDLEYAQRDIADVPLFEEDASPALASDGVAGIDLDPELADYDPFF